MGAGSKSSWGNRELYSLGLVTHSSRVREGNSVYKVGLGVVCFWSLGSSPPSGGAVGLYRDHRGCVWGVFSGGILEDRNGEGLVGTEV